MAEDEGGGGIQSESIGDYRVVYAKTMLENDEVKEILDKYRRAEGPLIVTPVQV